MAVGAFNVNSILIVEDRTVGDGHRARILQIDTPTGAATERAADGGLGAQRSVCG